LEAEVTIAVVFIKTQSIPLNPKQEMDTEFRVQVITLFWVMKRVSKPGSLTTM